MVWPPLSSWAADSKSATFASGPVGIVTSVSTVDAGVDRGDDGRLGRAEGVAVVREQLLLAAEQAHRVQLRPGVDVAQQHLVALVGRDRVGRAGTACR